MLNHKLAANLLKHIFQTAGRIRTTNNTNNPYVKTSLLEGFGGERYLALFTTLPEASVNEDGEYYIKAGIEPGIDNKTAAPSTNGYLRVKLSYNTGSNAGGQQLTDGSGVYYNAGTGSSGVSGNLIISDPQVGTGEEIDNGYGTKLNYKKGSTYIYNSDMIFFPESLEAWGDIVGFGIFSDEGKVRNDGQKVWGYLDDDRNIQPLNDNYYTNNLLFWGKLSPDQDGKEFITVGQNEIAIFRNNDFQVSINNESETE